MAAWRLSSRILVSSSSIARNSFSFFSAIAWPPVFLRFYKIFSSKGSCSRMYYAYSSNSRCMVTQKQTRISNLKVLGSNTAFPSMMFFLSSSMS